MPELVHDRIRAFLGRDPLDVAEELRELGNRRADAAGEIAVLEHRRKILLAELESERYDKGQCTGDKARAYAHSHTTYISFINEMERKIARHGRLDSEYWAKKGYLDYLNTAINFVKAETYALGRQT